MIVFIENNHFKPQTHKTAIEIKGSICVNTATLQNHL